MDETKASTNPKLKTKNIISELLPTDLNIKGNFSIKTLKFANTLNIMIKSPHAKNIFTWKERSISIKTILNNNKDYKKATSILKKYNIIFIDQLINKDIKMILNWKLI